MSSDPGSDGGGIEPAALVETAILVAARRRVVFGLGVTQQQQTAHGRNLNSVLVWTNLQAHVPDKVTSAAAVRKKRHARDFTSATNGPDDAPFRARLSFDLDVDICVVGAGLAGLTVALEAARLGASVAVLEGRHVGWNASGHQLGTVMPGYSLPIGELIERVGLEDARELWAMSKEGADYVRAAASEEAMPGIALTEGALEVSNVDAGETLISRLQTLSEDFETEVEGWQIDRVRDQLAPRYFHGIYYPRAFQIDGRKYVHGLAALARRAGARIFEDTPVVSIDSSGIRKRIVTP